MDGNRVRLGGGSRARSVVDQQAPDMAVRDMTDELFNVNPRYGARRRFVRLGDFRLEGDDPSILLEVRHRVSSLLPHGCQRHLGHVPLHPRSRQAPCDRRAERFQRYHSTALTRVAVAEIGVRIITMDTTKRDAEQGGLSEGMMRPIDDTVCPLDVGRPRAEPDEPTAMVLTTVSAEAGRGLGLCC